ncbi:hypothetical protein J6590_010459 [Homalodisca vitripennis]|nr:hypothetical protein J6590_010459 [Homalodisca vitripennis]
MKMYVTYPKDRPDSTIHWESGVRRTPNAAIDVVSTLALHYSVITSDTKRIAPPPPFPLRLSCRVLRCVLHSEIINYTQIIFNSCTLVDFIALQHREVQVATPLTTAKLMNYNSMLWVNRMKEFEFIAHILLNMSSGQTDNRTMSTDEIVLETGPVLRPIFSDNFTEKMGPGRDPPNVYMIARSMAGHYGVRPNIFRDPPNLSTALLQTILSLRRPPEVVEQLFFCHTTRINVGLLRYLSINAGKPLNHPCVTNAQVLNSSRLYYIYDVHLKWSNN